jgi:hypothetical protein
MLIPGIFGGLAVGLALVAFHFLNKQEPDRASVPLLAAVGCIVYAGILLLS